MIKNGASGTGNSEFNREITEAVSVMLECLLSKDKMDCNKCKSCEDVDVCFFLMESVVVHRHKEMRKTPADRRFYA